VLDCNRNRLDYGELLRPPDDYRLERAVATTYSADLTTLLSIPIALVYAQTLEGDVSGTRFQLLEAIKHFSRQVTVYHQKGQLHVPAKLNWLHAYLEDALVPILPADAFAAFHPKVWVIRYAPAEETPDLPIRYRVIVLSRNLTFDRSWDVAACLEGEAGASPVPANGPLVDFVNWLHGHRAIPEIDRFAYDLARVAFATPPPFDSHAFHPIGIANHEVNPVARQKAAKALVMSPFLHESAVKELIANTESPPVVFSERPELERLPVDLLMKFPAHHLSDLIVDGERMDTSDEGGVDVQQQHLHAKLFIFESQAETAWFLGSANSTKAARDKNIEFMLETRGTASSIRIRPRLKELTGAGEGPFVPFEAVSGGKDDAEERRKQLEIRRFEHALLSAKIQGHVETGENGKNYDLHLTLHLEDVPKAPSLRATVQPLSAKQGFAPHRLVEGTTDRCVFRNIAEVELSRFVHFRIEAAGGELQHEFLCRIEVDGLPPDRLDNILKKIIDSRDKFFDYLRFLLADEINKEDLLANGTDGSRQTSADADAAGDWNFHLPIYEQLLVTASRSPGKLADVDEVIRHLVAGDEESVIPETFLSFWESFRFLIPPKPSQSS
jgi:hypothetical protein